MRNERGYITTNITKLKRIIREYYEQPSEMNMLQKKHKEKKDTENLNILTAKKLIY